LTRVQSGRARFSVSGLRVNVVGPGGTVFVVDESTTYRPNPELERRIHELAGTFHLES
jgi:hypothetical protein